MASGDVPEHVRRRLAEDKKVSDRSRAEYEERMKGRPTPSQEENDLAAAGAHVMIKEHDGSAPDPGHAHIETRHLEAEKPAVKPATYQTRAAASSASKPASE